MEHCPGAGGSHYQIVPRTGREGLTRATSVLKVSYSSLSKQRIKKQLYVFIYPEIASIHLIYQTHNLSNSKRRYQHSNKRGIIVEQLLYGHPRS